MAEVNNLRPGLAGGIKTNAGATSDFSLTQDAGNPLAFWRLLVNGSLGARSAQLETADNGVVTVRMDETDGLKAKVIKDGAQVYPPV
mgnify:CR=1 FL=1